jgi:pilus assembly protein FimV
MQLRQLSTLVVILVGLFASSSGFALGLGDVTLKSSYNEPLNAEIRLLQAQNLSKNEILVGLASREDFARIGLEREFFLTSLKFTVILDDPDNAYVKVTSRQPVQEPYLNFLVNVQWSSGRLLREYTVLLDLPLFEGEAANLAAPIDLPQTQDVVASETAGELITEPVLSEQNPVSASKSQDNAAPAPSRKLASQSSTFSTPNEAADAFIQQLSRQAAARESSFNIESEAEPISRKKVTVAKKQTVSESIKSRVTETISPSRSALVPTVKASQKAAQATPAQSQVSQSIDNVKVRNGDTLWGLALKMRPSKSVSVQQTMLAIQQSNPEAFIGDNINMLRKGEVLRAPTLSEIQRTSSQEAVAAVKQQTQVWKQQRQKKSVLSAVSPDLSDPAQAPTQEGRVTLGSADSSASAKQVNSAGQSGSGESLQNELAIAQEELDKMTRENSNLNDRISELDKQNQTLESLVSATSEQLRMLELAVKNGESVIAPKPSPNVENMPLVEGQASKSSADIGGGETPSLIQQLISGVKSNLLYIVAILLLIILIALFFIRSKSNNSYDDEEFDVESDFVPLDADLEDDVTLYENEDGLYDLDDLDDDDNSNASVETIEAQTDDAVAEADIYVGLGQSDKAEELLQKEIQQNPDNADARLALLALYVTSQNANAFDDQYAQLLPLGNQSANEKAQSLRDELNTTEEFDVDSYSLGDEDLAESDNLVGDLEGLENEDLFDELERNLDDKPESDLDLENDLGLELGADDDLLDLDGELSSIDQGDDLLSLDIDDDMLSDLDEAGIDIDSPGTSSNEIAFDLNDDDELSEDLTLVDSLDMDDELSDFNFDLDDDAFLTDTDAEHDASKVSDEADTVNSTLDQDLSEELFELDLDDDLSEDNDAPSDQGVIDKLDSDQFDIEVSDGLSDEDKGNEPVPESTTVLTEDELDDFLGDDLDVSFDVDNKVENIDGISDETVQRSNEQSLSEDLSVEAPMSEPDDFLDDDLDLDLDLLDIDGDFEGLEAEEVGETVLSDEVNVQRDASHGSELNSDIEVDINVAAVPTEDFELEQELNEMLEGSDSSGVDLGDKEAPEFDLDLPPADVDMASLDLELDEMSSMLDDEPAPMASKVESEIEQSVEEGLDEALESIAEGELQDDHVMTDDSEVIAPIDDFGDDDVDFETSEDEVGTKLDLAQAYIDMGDFDGAEDILQEVIDEGDEEQKELAEKLLQSL